MKKVFVWGGWFGSRNIGDEAILLGIRNIFKEVDPEIRIAALTSDPTYTSSVHGVLPVQAGFKANFLGIFQQLVKSDMTLVSGGTPLYDYAHIHRMYKTLLPKLFKRKLCFFGVGTKRINSSAGKKLIKYIIDSCDSISVRDRRTREELTKVGVKRTIKVTGDPALFIQMKNVRKLKGNVKICICPRILSQKYKRHYHQRVMEDEIKNMVGVLSKTMEHLGKQGYKLYLIPFHRAPYDDDMKVVTKLLKGSNLHVTILNKDGSMTPPEVVGLIGQMDLVIGLRLHSLIFSAMKGVPMITFDYDMKMGGFMDMVGMSDFALSSTVKAKDFIEKCEFLLEHRKEVGKKMLRSIGEMKRNVLKDAREIRELLC